MMKTYRTRQIYGNFYENTGKPLVVILGGSRPGLPAPLNAGLLDYLKQEFNVLLLAYFGVGQLPKSIEALPLEYFVNAVSFIKREYNIPDNRVIVIGQSKGGEAALLLTNYMPSAVTIALVSPCYVFQGLPVALELQGFSNAKSSWSFQNKELPYIRFYFDQATIENILKKEYCECYEQSIRRNQNEAALIDVSNYSGRLFFISEDNDQYWPSKSMTEALIARSKNKNSIRHISMNLEGHYLLDYEQSAGEITRYLNALSFS